MYSNNKHSQKLPFTQKHIFDNQIRLNYMDSVFLKVRNFGPIKDVTLNLKNVNVFIGQQASGKSALAKIFTIFKAPRKFSYKKETTDNELIVDLDNEKATKDFKEVLNEYNIHSFLNTDTEIEYESVIHKIVYKNQKLDYNPTLLKTLSHLETLSADFSLNRDELIKRFKYLSDKFIYFRIRASNIFWREI